MLIIAVKLQGIERKVKVFKAKFGVQFLGVVIDVYL